MFKFLLSIFLFFLIFQSFGQNSSLIDLEKDLNQLSIDIISEANDSNKISANQLFKSKLLEAINIDGSFDYSFKNIKAISILSSNNKLKIYNWTLPFNDETFQYFAIIQYKIDKTHFKIIELNDKSADIKKPETQTLTDKNWFGALYYEIIYDKKLGSDLYTLLGWDGDYNLTNKKIIEVLNINKSGSVKFGLPIFKMEKKSLKRIIFTYSETTVMSLKYFPNIHSIVFDYLVPSDSSLDGVFEYYGPSLNRFDAFMLDKNRWLYQKDINIQLDKTNKDRFYHTPE